MSKEVKDLLSSIRQRYNENPNPILEKFRTNPEYQEELRRQEIKSNNFRTKALLRKKLYEYFTSITPEEMEYFKSLNIAYETCQSYFVYSRNQDMLYKFAAYYVAQSHKNHVEYPIKSFAGSLATDEPYEEKDILFLYNHKNPEYIGGTADFVFSQIINKIAERNRLNYPTVILSELVDNDYKTSDELVMIVMPSAFGGGVEVHAKPRASQVASEKPQLKEKVTTYPPLGSKNKNKYYHNVEEGEKTVIDYTVRR